MIMFELPDYEIIVWIVCNKFGEFPAQILELNGK